MTRLISPDELAVILNLHPRTIHKRRAAGTLGIEELDISTERGRQPRYRLADVEAFIAGRSTAPTINDLHDLVGHLVDHDLIAREHDRAAVEAAIREWRAARK